MGALSQLGLKPAYTTTHWNRKAKWPHSAIHPLQQKQGVHSTSTKHLQDSEPPTHRSKLLSAVSDHFTFIFFHVIITDIWYLYAINNNKKSTILSPYLHERDNL